MGMAGEVCNVGRTGTGVNTELNASWIYHELYAGSLKNGGFIEIHLFMVLGQSERWL